MTSQRTAEGFSPAIRARSTEASVCPARFKTPPGCARSGNMWPGRRRSAGVVSGSIAVITVAARSAAEIPVVVLPRASTETVKAVPKLEVFCSTIGGSSSSSHLSAVSARQIKPRPSRAMKLIASGVAFSAARTRSPSFSRSSSSTMTTNRPSRSSSAARSIEAKGVSDPLIRAIFAQGGVRPAPRYRDCRFGHRRWARAASRRRSHEDCDLAPRRVLRRLDAGGSRGRSGRPNSRRADPDAGRDAHAGRPHADAHAGRRGASAGRRPHEDSPRVLRPPEPSGSAGRLRRRRLARLLGPPIRGSEILRGLAPGPSGLRAKPPAAPGTRSGRRRTFASNLRPGAGVSAAISILI